MNSMRRVNFRLIRRLFILLLILIVCKCSASLFLPSSYVFHVPEVDIYVKTKKVWGGKFYVMFSEKKNIRLSSDVDYIEMSTLAYVKIIFDKENKKDIVVYGIDELNKINQVKFNLHGREYKQTYNRCLDDESYDEDGKFRSPPFSLRDSGAKEYSVTLNDKCLHEGGLWGR